MTRFLYDGDELIAEYDGAGTMLRRYVHANGAGDDPQVWFEGTSVATSARRHLYADERGSIIAVTDGNGNKLAINSYDEYGIPAATNTGRFQYTGQAWIPELGLFHYKARMYSPTLGRFMQTDPIGYEDQFNLYAYVANDPINGVDPTGLRYEVTYHRVAPIHPARHTAIRYTPEPGDQKRYQNDKRFQNIDADGNRYAVLSAGPESGNLVSDLNRPSDLGQQEGAVAFNTPDGVSEGKYFDQLVAADADYGDKMDYDLFPARAGTSAVGVHNDGHNSNSYVSGLIEATGGTAPQVDQHVPGYDRPVPERCFERGNSC